MALVRQVAKNQINPSPKWWPKIKSVSNTSTRKSTFTLVTLQSFSISGVISAEKCKLKNEKFTDVCMTGGMTYAPSYTNVCKFVKLYLTFPNILKLYKVTKVKVLFPVLVSVFHSVQF